MQSIKIYRLEDGTTTLTQPISPFEPYECIIRLIPEPNKYLFNTIYNTSSILPIEVIEAVAWQWKELDMGNSQ